MTPSVVIKAGFKNTKCTGPYKTRTKKSNNNNNKTAHNIQKMLTRHY